MDSKRRVAIKVVGNYAKNANTLSSIKKRVHEEIAPEETAIAAMEPLWKKMKFKGRFIGSLHMTRDETQQINRQYMAASTSTEDRRRRFELQMHAMYPPDSLDAPLPSSALEIDAIYDGEGVWHPKIGEEPIRTEEDLCMALDSRYTALMFQKNRAAARQHEIEKIRKEAEKLAEDDNAVVSDDSETEVDYYMPPAREYRIRHQAYLRGLPDQTGVPSASAPASVTNAAPPSSAALPNTNHEAATTATFGGTFETTLTHNPAKHSALVTPSSTASYSPAATPVAHPEVTPEMFIRNNEDLADNDVFMKDMSDISDAAVEMAPNIPTKNTKCALQPTLAAPRKRKSKTANDDSDDGDFTLGSDEEAKMYDSDRSEGLSLPPLRKKRKTLQRNSKSRVSRRLNVDGNYDSDASEGNRPHLLLLTPQRKRMKTVFRKASSKKQPKSSQEEMTTDQGFSNDKSPFSQLSSPSKKFSDAVSPDTSFEHSDVHPVMALDTEENQRLRIEQMKDRVYSKRNSYLAANSRDRRL
ncbi:hypothetical protein F5Y15DRAFT_416413 [Xylariaceae sp. FL0016]|nr:hypothetical protein F5Y15DRAFT_416413 [Xylariaceae sp. FL0016]